MHAEAWISAAIVGDCLDVEFRWEFRWPAIAFHNAFLDIQWIQAIRKLKFRWWPAMGSA